MIIEGYVTDKNGVPIANASVEVKGENFITLFSAESDAAGHYKLDIPAGRYPFLIAVKDYGVNCLEYWCQNIFLQKDMSLDVSFDKLELYGLHVFPVKGAGNGLMAYFRPMSLPKFQQGAQDIVPENITAKVRIDDQETPVINMNLVKEFAGDHEMSAYLIQTGTPKGSVSWKRFDLHITDADGHYGAATIFNPEIGE